MFFNNDFKNFINILVLRRKDVVTAMNLFRQDSFFALLKIHDF